MFYSRLEILYEHYSSCIFISSCNSLYKCILCCKNIENILKRKKIIITHKRPWVLVNLVFHINSYS